MRIKVYIVTYNNDDILRKNLEHIYNSDLMNYDYSVHIINNYSILTGFENYNNIEILNNVLRPDFSYGFLARNWNQAIINGFGSLVEPKCDILVTMQNDTFVKTDCFSDLIELHKKYDFIAIGAGDQLLSYTVDAIRQIGLWDERFCSIGHQEGDYFTSAFMLHKDKISICDFRHSRLHNLFDECQTKLIYPEASLNGGHFMGIHPYLEELFYHKWGKDIPWMDTNYWREENTIVRYPLIKRYYLYHYFEKDIKTLKEQNYFYIF
jgi:hypothetical protein